MDSTLFIDLLRNLIHVNVVTVDKKSKVITTFSNNFCYSEALQPQFTKDFLNDLVKNINEGIFYEVRDIFDNCIIIFKEDKKIYLVGPFARHSITEQRIQDILLSHKLPAAYTSSIKLYCGTFPVISASSVRSTINSLLHVLAKTNEDYSHILIKNTDTLPYLNKDYYEESFDFTTIRKRYELENIFLKRIEDGDIDNVLVAYHNMSLSGFQANRNVSAIYSDPYVSLTMLRALVRKAAERGGADIIEIHNITQQAVQELVAAKNMESTLESIKKMIYELTLAVYNSKLQGESYSKPINKTIMYIRNNYTQNISLDTLASTVGYSSPHLSKEFKKEVGITISDYIQRLRCNKAAEMLKESDTSIADISFYVGYPDNNYFTKVFKKQFGVTPTVYRNTNS